MNSPKAFDSGMASGSTGLKAILENPLTLLTEPAVIFKFASTVLSLIVYACMSNALYERKCLFNNHNGICRFGSLTLISFIICACLLVLEIVFRNFSSIKIRRRIAIADVVLSGAQTIFYLLLFIILALAWLKSDYPPYGHSINACRIAILLSFCAIFCMMACTALAYIRYQSGSDMNQFLTEDQIQREQEQYYVNGDNVEYSSIETSQTVASQR